MVCMHRKMVQGLHKIGFRIVLDVVYNHTFHSLQDGGSLIIVCPWLEFQAASNYPVNSG